MSVSLQVAVGRALPWYKCDLPDGVQDGEETALECALEHLCSIKEILIKLK